MAVAIEPLISDILQFHNGRRPRGLRRKFRRMAQGPFEFFRGTNFLFAQAWPELRPSEPGPSIWLCGDLHLENFGAFPTDDGDFCFDINDFDDAIVGPCSLDLLRCATSTLLAAESWRLTPTQGIGMVLAFLDSYRHHIVDGEDAAPEGEAQPELEGIGELVDATRRGSPHEMLEQFAKQKRGAWRIRECKRVRRAGDKSAALVREAIETVSSGGLRVLDVARRDSGIGSLGLRRFIVLAEEAGAPEPVLLALKESAPSAVAAFADRLMPDFANNAERAVAAQRAMQVRPAARLQALTIAERPYRMRTMIPDENRSCMKRLQKRPARLHAAVAAAGRLTARAQLRGSQVAGKDFSKELRIWARSPALESVLARAVRLADAIQRDFAIYRQAYRDGAMEGGA
jgi:uncharacterized protein (DUF2252 family)